MDCNAVEPNDLIFCRLSLPPEDVSAGRDGNYGSPKIDSATVEYGTGAVGLDDLIFHRTNLPLDEFSAGRNGDYIWRDLWTGPSVCNRPVRGSPTAGYSHRLEQCCLWLAALPLRWIRSAEVPLCIILSSWLAEHRMTWRRLSTLLCVVTLSEICLPSGANMIWSYFWILRCVVTLYGQMAEVYLLSWTCLCMIRVSVCVVSFLPLIRVRRGRNVFPSAILPTDYGIFLLLWPDRIETHSFHGQTR